MELESLLEKYKWQITLGFLGLILVGLGILGSNLFIKREEGIEILTEASEEAGEIFVDIQGAIEKPGLYKLSSNSRVNDLLIKAGGLSSEADREWVAKNLNLAQKLADGVKIYVPAAANSSTSEVKSADTSEVFLGGININTASLSELDTLWGIGSKRAQDIIDNRPYQQVSDLQTKKIIPSNVYDRIKDQITVY